MTKRLVSLLLLALLLVNSCKKEKKDSNGLPSPTQEGKNTLGFMLNGQPWTPQGYNGTANLSIDLDFGFNQGIFGIAAKRIISSANIDETFGIGVKDSLNFISIPVTLPITQTSVGSARFSKSGCSISFYEGVVFRSGQLTINKLDKTNRIIAGTFNVNLYKNGCSDTVRITDGRFDMKY